jgi:hypothetical protein
MIDSMIRMSHLLVSKVYFEITNQFEESGKQSFFSITIAI